VRAHCNTQLQQSSPADTPISPAPMTPVLLHTHRWHVVDALSYSSEPCCVPLQVLYRPGPPDEYFTYEVVWKQHVQHWHAEAGGALTERWSLGLFSGESVDAEVVEGRIGRRVLERKDFLARKKMEGRVWPYIEQKYTGGDRWAGYSLVRGPRGCSYLGRRDFSGSQVG
jgi:hypothetical protein